MWFAVYRYLGRPAGQHGVCTMIIEKPMCFLIWINPTTIKRMKIKCKKYFQGWHIFALSKLIRTWHATDKHLMCVFILLWSDPLITGPHTPTLTIFISNGPISFCRYWFYLCFFFFFLIEKKKITKRQTPCKSRPWQAKWKKGQWCVNIRASDV